MVTLTRILCRLWRCAAPSQGREQTAPSTNATSDDLTIIRGIGTATQDRLYRAGIKSFSELAQSSPDKIRDTLGKMARGAKVETWIEQAGGLAKGR